MPWPRLSLRPLYAGIASLTAFGAIAVLVHIRRLADLDLALMALAHSSPSAGLDLLAGLITYVAAAEVTLGAMLALSGWLWWRGLPVARALAPLLFLASIPPELLFKFTLDQPVPGQGFYRETLHYGLLQVPVMQSFPSGHAVRTAFMGLLGGYLLLRIVGPTWVGPLWLALAGICAIEAWSRAYLGHHWPMDVAGGYAMGAGLALLAVAAIEPYWSATPSPRSWRATASSAG